MKYTEDRWSPLYAECPPVLYNFVTKDVMTEEIRNDVLNAHEKARRNTRHSIMKGS